MDHGASEAILIRDGQAVEGATSNIFIVKKQRIITPPKSEHLLPGITRDLVLELAGQQGMPFEESAISEQALNEADEIWLTSSSKEVMAVVELNGQRVGNGKPGPIYSQIANHYQAYKNLLRKGSTL
jgi:D-alanine transaminase